MAVRARRMAGGLQQGRASGRRGCINASNSMRHCQQCSALPRAWSTCHRTALSARPSAHGVVACLLCRKAATTAPTPQRSAEALCPPWGMAALRAAGGCVWLPCHPAGHPTGRPTGTPQGAQPLDAGVCFERQTVRPLFKVVQGLAHPPNRPWLCATELFMGSYRNGGPQQALGRAVLSAQSSATELLASIRLHTYRLTPARRTGTFVASTHCTHADGDLVQFPESSKKYKEIRPWASVDHIES